MAIRGELGNGHFTRRGRGPGTSARNACALQPSSVPCCTLGKSPVRIRTALGYGIAARSGLRRLMSQPGAGPRFPQPCVRLQVSVPHRKTASRSAPALKGQLPALYSCFVDCPCRVPFPASDRGIAAIHPFATGFPKLGCSVCLVAFCKKAVNAFCEIAHERAEIWFIDGAAPCNDPHCLAL